MSVFIKETLAATKTIIAANRVQIAIRQAMHPQVRVMPVCAKYPNAL
jgi:hypothetical protein